MCIGVQSLMLKIEVLEKNILEEVKVNTGIFINKIIMQDQSNRDLIIQVVGCFIRLMMIIANDDLENFVELMRPGSDKSLYQLFCKFLPLNPYFKHQISELIYKEFSEKIV